MVSFLLRVYSGYALVGYLGGCSGRSREVLVLGYFGSRIGEVILDFIRGQRAGRPGEESSMNMANPTL